MLVLLRLAIGWHFFSEGMDHKSDPRWSSEGFLRQARGPLSPLYQSVVPDFHGFDDLMHGDRSEEADANTEPIDKGRARRPGDVLAEQWRKNTDDWWQVYRLVFKDFYNLNEEQDKKSGEILKRHSSRLTEWVNTTKPDFNDHVHQWRNLRDAEDQRASEEVPFIKKRVGDKQAALKGQAAGWVAQGRSFERAYEGELDTVLTPEQRERGDLPRPRPQLERVDKAMTYGILGIGVCLLLGLFTRTAAVLGAFFLLSVVGSQPFWISGSVPTYNHYVELLALMALATTHVGRWAGLDFFIHYLLVERCCSKGESHESNS